MRHVCLDIHVFVSTEQFPCDVNWLDTGISQSETIKGIQESLRVQKTPSIARLRKLVPTGKFRKTFALYNSKIQM